MFQTYFSPRFKRAFKQIPSIVKVDLKVRLELFMANPFHPFLRTHKLRGRMAECYAFELHGGFRVLFCFHDDQVLYLIDVGSHDAYKKWGRSV